MRYFEQRVNHFSPLDNNGKQTNKLQKVNIMEAIKVESFRTDYVTLAKRLLAVNGYSKENSYNPHNVKAYVIHNEFGVICVAVGYDLGDALDNAVDNDCLDSCLIEDNTDYDGDITYLGNASEPYDITYLGVLHEVTQYV